MIEQTKLTKLNKSHRPPSRAHQGSFAQVLPCEELENLLREILRMILIADIFVAIPYRPMQFAAINTKNNEIIHLFPQLWWERLKRHCGWLKGQENRHRSS